MEALAKTLMLMGLIIFLLSLFLLFAQKIPFLGNLPGDIHIKGKSFQIYFPIVTCLLLSLLLTLLLNLFIRR